MAAPQMNYFAVIPTRILKDDTLPPNAKLLYAVISSLCNQTGYCYARNEFFMEEFKFSERTVRDLLAKLDAAGAIYIEHIRSTGNQNAKQERHIYIDVDVVEVLRSGRNFPSLRRKFSVASAEICRSDNNEEYINNNPPQAPKGAGRAPKQKAAEWLPDRFEKFWQYYRKITPPETSVGQKDRAKAAWNRLRPDPDTIHAMGTALAEQSTTDNWTRGIGIPHASTWLNGRRWENREEFGAAQIAQQPAPEVAQW